MEKTWIAVVVVLVLIIGGLIGFLVGQNDEEEKWTEYTEETNEYVNIAHQYKVSPTVSPEVAKIVEVEYEADEESLKSGSLVVRITARNASEDQVIKRAHVSLAIIDKQGNSLLKADAAIGFLIPPGEKADYPVKLGPVFLDDLEGKAAGFIITLEQVDLVETSPPTPTEGSPGQVVTAFFKALREKRYSDAEKHLSSDSSVDINEMRKVFEEDPSKAPQKVEITKEEISNAQTGAEVTLNLQLLNGEIIELTIDLTKENGIWKIM